MTSHQYNAMTDNTAQPWTVMSEDRKRCPVAHFDVDGFAFHQVVDPDLIQDGLRRPANFSNRMGVIPLGQMPEGEQVLEFADPPEHTVHRQLVARAFSVARLNDRMAHIQQVADDLVDEIAAEGCTFDLRQDFGRPLPSIVVAGILGVPVSDRDYFMALVARSEELTSMADSGGEFERVNGELRDYVLQQFRLREDQPRDDLLSSILAAEADGQSFTRIEAAALVALLLGAGNGTTSIAISNTVHLLETNPGQKAKLLADLEGLAGSAVEEGLRFDPPVQGNFRGVLQDTTLGDTRLSAGERVFFLYASANHDPCRYDAPDEFRIDRDWSQLPPHLAFGHGIHYCIGAALARAETIIGLKTLYRRLPGLRLQEGFEVEQLPGIVFRTWRSVPMTFDGPVVPRLTSADAVGL